VANNEVQLEWQEERQGFGITQAVPRQQEGCLVFGQTLSSTPQTHQYVTGGAAQQSLDVYALQNGAELRPALVWLHGDDWRSGSKDDIDQIAFDIASQAGFHLVSVGYRLSAAPSAPWPETVHDAKAAIRWLKTNASNLGIAANALIVSGEGAGAHLAALIATSSDVAALEGPENLGTSSDVAAAVLFAGTYDFRTIVDQAEASFSSIGCAESFELQPTWSLLDCVTLLNIPGLGSCRASNIYLGSPAFHVSTTDPPMFIAHGMRDCVIPWQQSQDLADALSQAGVAHQFSVTETGMHEVNSLGVNVDAVLTFLNANLQCNN
jgi:acetyl esterase/lipase